MKVITIKQPFASLITYGYKRYEFRSWKTKYRGKIYIHAGMGVDKKRMNMVEGYNLNYPNGCIIATANLVDCILVDEKFNEQLKKENDNVYTTNHTGYYAWVLEDITPLEKTIKAKGQLSIWNYYNEKEAMDLMNDIEYGWVDKNRRKHTNDNDDNDFSNNYILQSPNEIIKNKIGVCYDQVELERYYFKANDWNIKTYFIVHYDNDKCPTHTFLTFKSNNKYYWFEHAWKKFRGIHKYSSLKELLIDVKDKFIKYELDNNCIIENLILREYQRPNYHISLADFFKHCELGQVIDINLIDE